MAKAKCPYCPQKFPTHHGLGGHLSGPCGIKLKAAKDKKAGIVVNFGEKMEAELRTEEREKELAAIPGKLVISMMELASAHRAKAEEYEKMANRIGAFA